jgi:hypothetical protein
MKSILFFYWIPFLFSVSFCPRVVNSEDIYYEASPDVSISEDRSPSPTEDTTTLQDVTPTRTHERCHWGTPECHYVAAAHVDENSSDAKAFVATKGGGKNDSPLSSTLLSVQEMSDIQQHRNHHPLAYTPPEGFILAAHIATDPITGLSYFEDTTPRTIPYQECGATGSTTELIAMKHAYFRHFPQSAHPSTWSASRQSRLVVALSRLEITVSGKISREPNSTTTTIIQSEDDDEEEDMGETRIFEPGHVILMEDFNPKGHKMRAAPSSDHPNDLNVLILIPQHHSTTTPWVRSPGHYHSIGQQMVPCDDWGHFENSTEAVQNKDDAWARPSRNLFQDRITVRRIGLGMVGMTISTAMAYFLSKVQL